MLSSGNRLNSGLWAAVARVFSPGCKFDNVLTLPGPQGIGKSTFFKTISGKWFNDSFSFASGDKEKVETITNGWIIEISELNGLKRANDVEAAKAFLSRCSDYMRPAYGHKVVGVYAPQCSLRPLPMRQTFCKGTMGTVDGGLSQSKATVMYQIGWIVCSIPFLNFGQRHTPIIDKE